MVIPAHLFNIAIGIVLLPNDPLGTAANPTPLGIPYVLDDYLDMLADAVSGSE